MRITGLHVDGFGLLHDQRVEDVPPGTTVVLGPNESGKSTLHAFLARTLFGHPRLNDAAGRRRHEPLRGGAHGGVVTAADPAGHWEVHRYTDRSPRLRVVRPDGTEATGPDAVLDLVGRAVDAERFEQVFAIDLDDLGGVGSLGGGALDDLLFDAATVGTGRSLRAALAAAEERRDQLWTPTARQRPLAAALTAAQEARASLRAVQADARSNLDARRRLDEVERLVGTLGQQQEEVAAEAALLARVEDAWPAWQELAAAEEELAALPALTLDEERAAAARAVAGEVEELRRRRSSLHTARDEAAERAASISVDRLLLAVAEDVEALHARLPVHEHELEQAAAGSEAVRAAQARLEDARAEIGEGWDDERIRAVPTDSAAREELALVTDEVLELRAALTTAQDRVATAVAVVADRQAELEEQRAGLVDAPDPAEVEVAEGSVAVLRAALPAAVAARAGRPSTPTAPDAVQSLIQQQHRRRSRLGWVIVASGAVVSVLGVLALGVATLPEWVLPAALGLAVGLGTLTVGRRIADRRARVEHGLLPVDGVEPNDELLAAANRLGLSWPVTPAALDTVTRRVAEARAQVRDRELRASQVVSAQRGVAEAEERLGAHQHEVAVVQQRLDEVELRRRQVCGRLGLDATDDPRVTVVRLERIAAARRALGELERAVEPTTDQRANIAAFRERAAALVVAATEHDEAVDGVDAVRQLPSLAARCRAAVEAAEARAAASAAAADAEERFASADAALAAAEARLAAAVEELGLPDVAALDDREDQLARRAAVVDRQRRAAAQVDSLLGVATAGEHGRALLATADPVSWGQRRAELEQRAEDLRAERDRAVEERTRLRGELEALGGDDAVPQAHAALAAAEAEVTELAERWAVADVAVRVLEETVARFEREQQPRVLERASELFAAATRRRWRQVRRLDGALVVSETKGGEPVAPEVLSRGTREQLWLSLRLALAADLSHATPLPLLIDDLLGTSDPTRAVAVARVLADVAQRQQVWVFTCDPVTAERIVAADPGASVLEMARGGRIRGWMRHAASTGPAAAAGPDQPHFEF